MSVKAIFSKKKCFHFLLLLALSNNVLATDLEEDSLFSLSLDQLMEIRVTTASKFEESIRDTHASISIITEEQIAQFGGTYLNEILERVVGVNSVFNVMTTMSTRGSTPWTSIVRHLVLINGRPTGNVAGGHNLYSSFPLSSIAQIEYIRGPGSVLYGTNAYYGVINIITKKAKQDGWEMQHKMSAGSFGQKTIDGNYLYKNGDFKATIATLLSDEDGWDAKMFDPIAMDFYSRKAFQKEKSFLVDIQKGNFSYTNFYSHQERFANFWDAPEANYIPWFKDNVVNMHNLSHKYSINENWRIESHLTLLNKKVEWNSNGVADDFARLVADVDIQQLEMNLFAELDSNSTLLFGANREERKTSNSFTVPEASEDYFSLYMQYQNQATDQLSYMLGAQYFSSINLKDGADNKSGFVPRAGLIYDVNEQLTLKLLYGNAYRQPQVAERYIDSPGIEIGNPDIQSEEISTMEGQIHYQNEDSMLVMTYFHSKEKNLITLTPQDDDIYPLRYNNSGTFDSRGIEIEYKYQPNDRWMLELAWSNQSNKNSQGEEQTTLMPDYSWKLGVAYNINSWRLGLYNLYYGDYQDSISIVSNRELVNPEASSFNWTTFKAATNIAEFKNSGSLEFAFEVKNILDEEVYYPQDVPTFYPINTVPGRGERSFILSVTYRLN